MEPVDVVINFLKMSNVFLVCLIIPKRLLEITKALVTENTLEKLLV
jgi:hypothetical protein